MLLLLKSKEKLVSNGQIRRWDKASPKVENVQKVADFFGASIDDLLERKEISKRRD